VGELAVRFHCSPRHLNRIFRARLGCSAAEFRTSLRLLKAARLLRDPAAKVRIVARQCGFNDVTHFTRSFRRRFGRSPGKWRDAKSEVGEPRGSVRMEKVTRPLRVGETNTLELFPIARGSLSPASG